MRIIVTGAGAMGSVFGGKLARAGCDITLHDIDARQIGAIAATGVKVTDPDGTFTQRVKTVTDAAPLRGFDLALVMVDSNATAAVAPMIPALLAADGFALTLQNGIGNIEALAAHLGEARVVGGVTYVSAAMAEPGHTLNTNVGETTIGDVTGGISPRVERLAALLNSAGFPTAASDNIIGHVWSKFALNCALNPLSALTGLRPGEVARQLEMSALLDTIIAEILAVVTAKGITLPEPDPAHHIREHAFLRYNRPSMLQHVEAGRRTEITSLNAALVREAEAMGIAVPANRAIAALVHGIDSRAARGEALDERELEREAAAAFARNGIPS